MDQDPNGSAFIFSPESGSRREQFKKKKKKINGRKLVVFVIFQSGVRTSFMVFTFEESFLSFSTLENSS